MLDGSVVKPIMQLAYRLVLELGALLWWIDRSILLVGYYILALTDWLTQSAFSPLISGVAAMTSGIAANMFVVAMMVLALTYLLAVFFRLDVVDPKSAFLWLLFASLIFQVGPEAYLGLERLRRGFGGAMYQEGVDVFSGSGSGLAMIGSSAESSIDPATNQFGTFVPSDTGVDGLDVAMAYVRADAYDVLTPSTSPHAVGRLPYQMMRLGGCLDIFPECNTFFDPLYSASHFGDMDQSEREQAIGLAFQGVMRLGTGVILALFGLIEQVIYFVLAIAFGLAFVSLFIAILFAFFKHTEPIAWSVFNLILELFIQSVITSLMLALVIGFVLIGAQTGNGVVLLGAGFVGLILGFGLFVSALKGVLNAGSRLFQSFGQITGGSIVSAGEMAGYAGAVATGGVTLAAGGTIGQATGATFGNSKLAQQAYYASRALGEDSRLGGFANDFSEGAAARQFGGPVGGYLLGSGEQTSRQVANQQAGQASNRDRTIQTPRAIDQDADAAIAAYRDDPVNNYPQLERTFGEDAREVARLADSYNDDEFDAVVGAVRAVRNNRPAESPESPRFSGQVRAQVQGQMTAEQMAFSPLGDMPPDDLVVFSRAFAYRPPANDRVKRQAEANAGREDAVSDRARELAEEFPDSAPTALRRRAGHQLDIEARAAHELGRVDRYDPYREAFRGYQEGATDRESERALNAFQGDTAQLAGIFDHLDQDDFNAVVSAMQALEVIQPQAAQAPGFSGDVEQRLGPGHPLYGDQARLGTILEAMSGGQDEGSPAAPPKSALDRATDSVAAPDWDHSVAAPAPDTGAQALAALPGSDQPAADPGNNEPAAAAAGPQALDRDDFTPDDARQLAHLNDSHQANDFAQLGSQLGGAIRATLGSIRFDGAIPTVAGAAAMVSASPELSLLAGQQPLQQATGQFIVQAAQAGLTGTQAGQVFSQVAQTGQLSPPLQQMVAQSFQQAHPEATAADGQQAAAALERAATALSQSARVMQHTVHRSGPSPTATGTVPPPAPAGGHSGGAGIGSAPVASPRTPNAGGRSPVVFDFDGGDL